MIKNPLYDNSENILVVLKTFFVDKAALNILEKSVSGSQN